MGLARCAAWLRPGWQSGFRPGRRRPAAAVEQFFICWRHPSPVNRRSGQCTRWLRRAPKGTASAIWRWHCEQAKSRHPNHDDDGGACLDGGPGGNSRHAAPRQLARRQPDSNGSHTAAPGHDSCHHGANCFQPGQRNTDHASGNYQCHHRAGQHYVATGTRANTHANSHISAQNNREGWRHIRAGHTRPSVPARHGAAHQRLPRNHRAGRQL